MVLADKLGRAGPRPAAGRGPVWKGPEEDGVTQSLLSRFLNCRERFRLLVVEGLRPHDTFNHRLEYGNLWHTCEEALASERSHFGEIVGTTLWKDNLKKYAQALARRYPLQQEQVAHWYEVCRRQFPLYVKYWADHPDVTNRTPLLQEQVFAVPYRLPSGRVVRLRGKWDSVDLVKAGKCTCGADRTGPGAEAHDPACPAAAGDGVWLMENKTKGDIRPEQVQRQLTFDLQTLLYLVALGQWWEKEKEVTKQRVPGGWVRSEPIVGVRYNVVRRPLSGGEGTVVRHKATAGAKCPKCKGSGGNCPKCGGKGRVGAKPAETSEHFYDRVAQVIKERPEHFFMRWNVTVLPADIERFRRRFLDPVLEQLCDWWQWVSSLRGIQNPFNSARHLHWQHPFGCTNWLDEGGSSDLDSHLLTGSTVGLTRTENLFPELT